MTDIILPTGEKVQMHSDLTVDEGLTVKIAAPLQALKRGDDQRTIEYLMKNDRSKMLTIKDGEFNKLSNISANLKIYPTDFDFYGSLIILYEQFSD